MSMVGFRAKNHPQQVSTRGADDGVDERITPASIYEPLDADFDFTLDPAANAANAKTTAYFTIETDGLRQSWGRHNVWCNPPYSACEQWVAKAWREVSADCPVVVMLLPSNRTEQAWWQIYVEPFRDGNPCDLVRVSTRFLKGRPRFGWPPGRKVPPKGDRPPFGLVVVVFRQSGATYHPSKRCAKGCEMGRWRHSRDTRVWTCRDLLHGNLASNKFRDEHTQAWIGD